MPDLATIALYLAAGFLGGSVNVAAGGAKLFVFPILLAAGLPPVAAAATATVGLWPAQLPGVFIVRKGEGVLDRSLITGAILAAIGGGFGGYALVTFGEASFVRLVPVFLVIAVVAILLGEKLASYGQRLQGKPGAWMIAPVLILACGVYAGYFGAGLGFMLIATILISGETRIHAANAKKNLYSVTAATFAVVPLSLSGEVAWTAAGLVLIGGLLGGFFGAKLLTRVPPLALRIAVSVLGTVMILAFLARG
ncbi:MAG: sulfite exporter TauE/SafE family protein [Pseudomonadota bacterium]